MGKKINKRAARQTDCHCYYSPNANFAFSSVSEKQLRKAKVKTEWNNEAPPLANLVTTKNAILQQYCKDNNNNNNFAGHYTHPNLCDTVFEAQNKVNKHHLSY